MTFITSTFLNCFPTPLCSQPPVLVKGCQSFQSQRGPGSFTMNLHFGKILNHGGSTLSKHFLASKHTATPGTRPGAKDLISFFCVYFVGIFVYMPMTWNRRACAPRMAKQIPRTSEIKPKEVNCPFETWLSPLHSLLSEFASICVTFNCFLYPVNGCSWILWPSLLSIWFHTHHLWKEAKSGKKHNYSHQNQYQDFSLYRYVYV